MNNSCSPNLNDRLMELHRLSLTERQLFDLEMIAVGGFSPLEGFLTEENYINVVDRMRLKNDSFWPMPIVLDVHNATHYHIGDELILCDRYNNPIAFFRIESKFTPDKKKEALAVYGTLDEKHPGVFYLMHETGNTYLGGSIEVIKLPQRNDFKELRRTPEEVRALFKKKGIKKVAAFQTRNPVHRAHFEVMRSTSRDHGVHILLHPVVGLTKTGDIDHKTRVRSYLEVHEKYMKDFATLSLLPLAMRMAGPREALWHALIRKNYGATHFIVGRDHAGPGNDSTGKPFYAPYAAQELAKEYEQELGIAIVTHEEMVYVDEDIGYVPASKVPAERTPKNISGTRVREMLLNDEEIPSWFSFPEVVSELRRSMAKQKNKGFTVFFTGLPSAGKSTIAEELCERISDITGREITILDGDIVRHNLSKGLGFSKEDRDANVLRIGFVASEIVKHGGVAICAAVAPYANARAMNRRLIEQYGDYIEIHIATPLSVCEKRDTKGLYKKARRGLLSGMTGINDPYEEPNDAEARIDTTAIPPGDAADMIIALLRTKNLI